MDSGSMDRISSQGEAVAPRQDILQLLTGGSYHSPVCQDRHRCQCQAYRVIGHLHWCGVDFSSVRSLVLDAKNRGMLRILQSKNPRETFLGIWNSVDHNARDRSHIQPQGRIEFTDQDRMALTLHQVERRPGISSRDLRKAVLGRNELKVIAVKNLVQSGHIRTEQEGQRVRHYRTSKVYGPLDAVRALEDIKMFWYPEGYGQALDLREWVLEDYDASLALGMVRAEYMSNTSVEVNSDNWASVYQSKIHQLQELYILEKQKTYDPLGIEK